MPEGRSKVIYYSDLMPRYIIMAASAVLILCVFSLQALAAGEQSAPTSYNAQSLQRDPVHQLIESHVQAIKTRNAAEAYHLISMNGQEKYGTPKSYWRDVRQNMRLLFNHNSYKFMGRNTVNGMVIQKVNMSDDKGKESLVIFRVLQDDKQAWRIENIIITNTGETMA
jgi:hypothetical protein